MQKQNNLPELLCPAGSPEAFRAAIEGGADAIYVGGTAFNARINAKNFTVEQMKESISLAHAYGVKVYVAANTLIYDRELPDMLRAAEDAYLCGADALIVADLGAAEQIRRRIPIELHASTQMSGHNANAAKFLAERGFSRMVCAREMSRDDLWAFVKNSPIEAEVFVHGALCVCHSGQCLFSSLVGGRSGNRGECAQPCRLPFRSKGRESYPLSLKDLSLACHLPELAEMGVASLKIEGRMKSPEYVRDVARIFRRLLDEGRGADENEMTALAEIFSRGGFTDGYYTKKIGRSMLGIRSENDKQSSRALIPFDKIERKLPLTLSAELKAGKPISLTASDGKKTVTVYGAVPEEARTAPLTREAVEKNLSKLGNTPYFLEKLTLSLSDGIILPLSSINALRRLAVEKLAENGSEAPRSENDFIETKEEITAEIPAAKSRTALFYFPDRIPREAYGYFDVLYTPLEKYNGETNGVLLPPVIFDGERERVEKMLQRAKELGAAHLLIGNVGHIELAKASGLILHGDHRANMTNAETARLLSPHLTDVIASPELTLPKLRDLCRQAPNVRTAIYGRTPLMITEKCVGKELGGCDLCNSGKAILTDRRGVTFPVLRIFDHRSLIVNSLPLYMADKGAELDRMGISATHFIFTVESREEIARIISAYKKRTPPTGEVRRIK